MGEPAAKEPTMEEILASIRRIISEDGEPVGEASGGEEPTVSAAHEDDTAGAGDTLAPDATPDAEEHLLSMEELLGDDLAFDGEDDFEEIDIPSPVEDVAAAEATPAPVAVEEPVVDFEDAAAEVVTTAAPVQQEPVKMSEPRRASSAPSNVGMDTAAAGALEGFVRSMIEPMINEWLEDNLEGIVNAKVDAELQRVATRVRQALVEGE